MDKNEALIIAEKYIKSINSFYKINQAYLFGSFAKGTNHIDSDIDIAIVLGKVKNKDIFDTQIDLMKLRRNVDIRIEPHPIFKKDFNVNNPIFNEILLNGIDIKN